MKKKHKFFLTFLFILCLFSVKIWSQKYNIDYYGIVSTDLDANMAKMTSDLYFTQLSEINNFKVTDKRDSPILSAPPEFNNFSHDSLAFYTVIQKNPADDSWHTVFHVIDTDNNEEHTKKKIYASFYKILMESKNELKDTIRQLIESDKGVALQKNNNPVNNKNLNTGKTENVQTTTFISAENLSGTWKGEENIDKVVILRGGRGFVIFKNGASMNISVKISESESNQIIIKQNSKSNASFFPELPRNTALSAAPAAEPIQWILTVSDNNTLQGVKQTLIPEGDSFKKGEIPVEWTKSS